MMDLSWIIPLRTENLTNFFRIFPFFASTAFYMIIISVGYWSWDKKQFKGYAILICLSSMLNCWLKFYFKMPRPPIEHLIFVHDPFSFPSGDVQIVTTFWVALSWHFKQPLLWLFSLLLILFVAISRIYLGVHYPIDVVAGSIVGVLLVAVYYNVQNSNIWKQFQQNEILFSLTFIVLLGLYLLNMNYDLNIVSVTASGVLLGLFLGSYLDRKFCRYTIGPDQMTRLFATFIGLSTLFVLRTLLLDQWQHNPPLVYAFIIYVIIGTHIMFVAPWLTKCITNYMQKIYNEI